MIVLPIYLFVLGSDGCVFSFIGQVSELVGDLIGQASEVVWVCVGLCHMGNYRMKHDMSLTGDRSVGSV